MKWTPSGCGAGVTMNGYPGLELAFTLTTRLPVVAPVGTGTLIAVSLQLEGTPIVPLNVTELLVPCVAPKPEPLIVISWFAGAEFISTLFTEIFVINGFVTVKLTELLALFTVTTTPTVPAIIPFGTTATIDLLFQDVVDATELPNVTVLVPCVAPKLLPAMVTEVPDAPEVGDKLEMTGAANREPLARTPKAKTTTARRNMHVLRNQNSVLTNCYGMLADSAKTQASFGGTHPTQFESGQANTVARSGERETGEINENRTNDLTLARRCSQMPRTTVSIGGEYRDFQTL
jgi:hypothetical protein